jgi:DNA translocase FtsK
MIETILSALFAVVLLVGVAGVPAYMVIKSIEMREDIKRINKEREINERRFDLGLRLFTDIDFEKYPTIKELEELNESLKDLQKIKRVEQGVDSWFEAVKVAKGKVKQEGEIEYIGLEESGKPQIPLNWNIDLLKQSDEVAFDEEQRNRRIREAEVLKDKVNSYFESCFNKNVIETLNAKITWQGVEFFLRLAIEQGTIEEKALESELTELFSNDLLWVKAYQNIVRISIKTREKEIPTSHFMFSKFASEGVPKTPLTILAGVDPEGRVRQYDLATTGGILLCGTVGTGKSNFVRQVVSSIMLHNKPDEVKFVLYNPYKIEFEKFENSPYLYTDVLKKEEDLFNDLEYLENEVDRRLNLFSELNVHNLSGYNEKVGASERLPYIVAVVDEIDYLLQYKQEAVMEVLKPLLAKCRVAGVVCLLTASNARSYIIPQNLKIDLPCVVTFRLASELDGEIAIGMRGVDRLGTGEIFIKWNDSPEPSRISTPYISDYQMAKIVEVVNRKFSW